MKALIVIAAAVVLFSAASFPASPANPALEVVVLGSGGPRAFGRAGSSYILLVEGRPRILVDAGPGAFLRIGELGLDLQKVDMVLLTHLHIDHSGDLAAFFNARALTSDGPIMYRIFGPDGAGLFPKTSRFVDLLVGERRRVCISEDVWRATNRLRFAIWRLTWIPLAPRLWMRMA